MKTLKEEYKENKYKVLFYIVCVSILLLSNLYIIYNGYIKDESSREVTKTYYEDGTLKSVDSVLKGDQSVFEKK